MTTHKIIEELKKDGGSVSLEGDGVRLYAPAHLFPRYREALKSVKSEVVAILRRQAFEQCGPGRKVVLSGVTFDKVEQILAGIRAANDPLRIFVWGPIRKIFGLRSDGCYHRCDTAVNLSTFCESDWGLWIAFYSPDKFGKELRCDLPVKAIRTIIGLPPEATGLPILWPSTLLDGMPIP